MQNKTIIVHISHEFIHYTLFSVNCYSVLLSTLAQAFWIEHYEEIKKLPVLHISCSRICIKKVILVLVKLDYSFIIMAQYILIFFPIQEENKPKWGSWEQTQRTQKRFCTIRQVLRYYSDIIIFDRDDKDISSSFSLL